MRDFQVSKVYIWEHLVLQCQDFPNESLKSLATLLECIVLDRGLKSTLLLSFDKTVTHAHCTTTFEQNTLLHRIKLPEWGRNKIVLLHETAHAITKESMLSDGALYIGHGPEFVGNYVDLLEKYAGFNSRFLCIWLDKSRIKWERRGNTNDASAPTERTRR